MKKKGFTAVELLVSIGVIILISLISLPLFVGYQKSTKLKSEIRVLATNLRLAQQLAITEQIIYQVKLFPADKKYQIINSQTSEITKEVTLNSEVSIIGISGFTDNTIQFNATGGVVETGSITLTNTQKANASLEIKPSGYVQINE